MADMSAGGKDDARDIVSSLSHSLQRSWPSDKNMLQSAKLEAEGRKMDTQQQEKRLMSGLLRKASMLCKPGGGVDPSHKSLMKNLVMNNDAAIVAALDASEAGNASELNTYLQLISVDDSALSGEQKSTLFRERKSMVDQFKRNIGTLARKRVKQENLSKMAGPGAVRGPAGPLNAAQSEFERRRIEQGLGSKRDRPGSMMALTSFPDSMRLRTVTEKGGPIHEGPQGRRNPEEQEEGGEGEEEDSDDDGPVMRVDVAPAHLLSQSQAVKKQPSSLSAFQLNAQKQQRGAPKAFPAPAPPSSMLSSAGEMNKQQGADTNQLLSRFLELQKSSGPINGGSQQRHAQTYGHQDNQHKASPNNLGLAALGSLASVASNSAPSSSPTTPNATETSSTSPTASGPNNNVFNLILMLQQKKEAIQEKQQAEFSQIMQALQDKTMDPQTLMHLVEHTKLKHEQETRELNEQLTNALYRNGAAPSASSSSLPSSSPHARHDVASTDPKTASLSALFSSLGANGPTAPSSTSSSSSSSASSPSSSPFGSQASHGAGIGLNGATNGDFGAGIGIPNSASSSMPGSSSLSPNAISTLLSRYAASTSAQSSGSPYGGPSSLSSNASNSSASSNNHPTAGTDPTSSYGQFGLGGSPSYSNGGGPAHGLSSTGLDQQAILRRLLSQQQQHQHSIQQGAGPGMMSSNYLASLGVPGLGGNDNVSSTGSPVADLVISRQREREARKQVKLEVRREKKSTRERQRRLVLNTKYDELCALLFDPVERESKDRASVLQTAIDFIHETEGTPVPDRVPGEDEIEEDDDDDQALPAGPNLTQEQKALRRRLKKSRREKQRRHNVNILSERLGTMLAVPEVKEKAVVLQTAIQRIAEKKGVNLPSSP
ncbi:Hypothetical Protein FCC1311_076652 [Hondaea fermentalgiana]|uniref:BHLH domain-containing protein n=1 Tax=Hondaea fermentalgiana TaxID=2315210 RepID=A0A2R5GST7_9STRA|nr:Hypothetical Protein FCC1311_076652 [Hondaea fermentalgiana]|eukprot:GBG31441.1 Hypothetical Protein FCC1311_076652 [Hondaea fermentalgiana]